MELACFMRKKGIRASVEGNREAGALANGVHSGFILLTVCTVIPERELCWEVLPQALRFGSEAEESFKAAKDANATLARNVKQPRRRPEDRLRAVDPC